jgi:hypothetical protein
MMSILVLVVVNEKRRVVRVELSRAEKLDSLPIAGTRNEAALVESLLHAIMSTAPIPALDDELLVG